MCSKKTISLKPALIIGSGFHRHVFGDGADRGSRACLVDWNTLISNTARKMQVAVPSLAQSPVLRWESMIIRAARDGYRDYAGTWKTAGEEKDFAPGGRLAGSSRVDATYLIEEDAKKVAACLLQEAGAHYPHSSRAMMPASDRWGCVISLNFDTAWRPNVEHTDFQPCVSSKGPGSPQGSRSVKIRRMSWSVGQGKKEERPACSRLWFPNGTVLDPATIRMGLRDYGGAPNAIQEAFDSLKAWERKHELTSIPVDQAFKIISRTLTQLSNTCPHPLLDEIFGHHDTEVEPFFPLTWVAEFLYRPLVFAGVGLSDQESGLWWLLAQRARNLARVTDPTNASVRILMRRSPHGKGYPARDSFWATRPFGIEPVYCDDWDEGWERIVGMTEMD